jgi:chromosome segregation ATPase
MYSKDRSDSEFQLVLLAEDSNYQAARSAVADAEKAMLAAEQRYRSAQTPAQERSAWQEIENARKALDEASNKRDEVASRRSLEVCETFRAEHQRHLRDLLEKLEGAAEACGCLAAFESRITASGHSVRSDILGVALPPAIFELGSRADYGSQLARFRRELAAKGAI